MSESLLHRKVLRLLEDEKKGTLLDAPAGIGELSILLAQRNFDVLSVDINDASFQAKSLKFSKADLNVKFPFSNCAFDYAVCVEWIEHLENPHHVIGEFARVLKPGGKFIITTPNILNIFSRLRYLLIGYHEYYGDYFNKKENFYVFHINPVSFWELEYILKNNNLDIETVTTEQDVFEKKGLFLGLVMLLLLPLINVATRLKVKDRATRNLFLSPELLKGNLLILKCRKTSE